MQEKINEIRQSTVIELKLASVKCRSSFYTWHMRRKKFAHCPLPLSTSHIRKSYYGSRPEVWGDEEIEPLLYYCPPPTVGPSWEEAKLQ